MARNKNRFEYKEVPEDDAREYFLNGKSIVRATHDDHGWSGIELADTMFYGIAHGLGEIVSEISDEAEE